MRRIQHSTRVTSRPAQSYSDAANGGFFTEGDPANGTPATRVVHDWLNDAQETLANPIEAVGHTLGAGSAYDGQLTESIKLLGHGFPTTVVNSTPYNISAANVSDKAAKLGRHYAATGAAGAITINLPAASSAGDGATLLISKTDSSGNGIVIAANGSDTIAGAGNLTLDAQHDSAVLVGNGSAWAIAGGHGIETVSGQVLPTKYLAGLTLANNGSDPTNDIDIAAGKVRSDDDAVDIIIAANFTKRLDAAYANGTGNGGLDTGAKANSTCYHAYAIASADGASCDIVFTATYGSPTMPSGFTKKARLGAFRTNGTGTIYSFEQIGDWFLCKDAILDVNGTSVNSTGALYNLSVPTGLAVEALVNLDVTLGASENYLMTPPYQTDVAVADFGYTTLAGTSGEYAAGNHFVRTNSSGQIRLRSASSATTYVRTVGWVDRRNK